MAGLVGTMYHSVQRWWQQQMSKLRDVLQTNIKRISLGGAETLQIPKLGQPARWHQRGFRQAL